MSLQSSLQLAELYLTGAVELATAAPTIPLDDPAQFEQWWFNQVQSSDRNTIADQLAVIGTPLAMVRCGQVLGYHLSALERGTRCYAAGLLSEDPAVRLFALLRLAHFKTQIGYAALGSDLHGSPTAIPAAEAILETAESLERQSLLLVEVKTRAHALLAEAHWLEGRHETAKRHIAQALLMADALGLWASKQRMELMQYEIHFDSGQVRLALEQCQRLAEDPNTQAVFANRSGHTVALAYIAIGDDDAAIEWCSAHINDGGVYPFLRSYAQAVAGIGGLECAPSDYPPHITSELSVLYQCRQLLLEPYAKLDATTFHQIQRLCDTARSGSKWVMAEFAWFKSYAAYRTGEFGLAQQFFPKLEDVPSEQTALRCMILALSLEISTVFLGRDHLPPIQTAQKIQSILLALPSGARQGIARRISILLPTAGAFLAYSPYSTTELVEYCAGAVMRVLGKLLVHRDKKIQPIHAGVVTLEDFGLDFKYHPNKVQADQLRDAMLFTCGSRLHWHRAISPALLVYAYFRMHWLTCGKNAQSDTSHWEQNALTLISSHGLFARPRGFEVEKRHRLENALNLLARKAIHPKEVQAII